jgi:hypothetical protein
MPYVGIDAKKDIRLNATSDLDLTSDSTTIKFGADDDVTLTHVHNTGLLLNSTNQFQFGDSGTYIHQSADGVLDLVSDTEIEINATTIDINGALDLSGNATIGGAITGTTATFTTADNSDTLTLISTDTDASKGPNLVLKRDNNSGAGDDLLGTIDFIGEDAGNNLTSYVTMSTMIQDVTGGSEDGRFQLKIQSGGNSRNVLDITGTNTIHFNSDGENIDFRYDSDTIASALFIDGATGYISTGTLGSGNVRLGYLAGDDIQSGGNYNVMIGENAGTDVQTGDYNTLLGAFAGENVTGGYNTFVGGASGDAVTSGDENTAVGYASLTTMSTGIKNVALGPYAMRYNQKGDQSVAVGYQALGQENRNVTSNADMNNTSVGYNSGSNAILTGTNNNLFGSEAGFNLTSGSNNVAVGRGAMYTSSTGEFNTALGHNALFYNQAGDRTVAIGAYSLNLSNPSGNADMENTAVGYQTGYYMTTATNTTLLGTNAGLSISTGNANTAIGNEAMIGASGNKTTGSYNTACGYRAGYVTQGAGANNAFFGDRAGYSNTTADSNTAVGSQALFNNVDGNKNTAIGAYALYSMDPSGAGDTEHTAVGYEAAKNVTSATGNTAIGFRAGAASGNASTGQYNTSLGRLAGNSLTSGSFNICIGYVAGDLITEGDSNICIGSDTGSTGNNLTSGSKNIFIGNNVNGPTTSDNAIGIGDGVVVSANDFSFGKTSNIVTNDFDADANWSRSSDERLKKNITDQKLGLDFINDLRTVKYNWKASHELDPDDSQLAHLYKEDEADNEMNTTATMHNFIAQEVKTALDTAGVSDFGGWKEDQFGVQQVSREMFVIPLVKAVQELSAKVITLEAEVTKLKGT